MATEQVIALSTGRVVTANEGLIGISGKLDVRKGYDGRIDGLSSDGREEEQPLTALEKVELAEHMIALWEEFKAAAEAEVADYGGRETAAELFKKLEEQTDRLT